jgi:rfaE bifunctional protein kinase chain/domain
VRTIVDSRYRLRRFAGATAATPNEAELEELVGAPIQSDAEVVEAANRVATEMGLEAMLVTRGSRGVLLIEREREPLLLPIVGSAQAVDVTGAGDTVIAAFALALAAGASYGDAARLANHAGGLVVMKRGTATVSNAELAEAVREGRVGFAYREHRGTEIPELQ